MQTYFLTRALSTVSFYGGHVENQIAKKWNFLSLINVLVQDIRDG